MNKKTTPPDISCGGGLLTVEKLVWSTFGQREVKKMKNPLI